MIVPKIWCARYVTAQENCAGPGEGKGGGGIHNSNFTYSILKLNWSATKLLQQQRIRS